MADILKGIAMRQFSGDSRRGERRAYLLRELVRRGCRPSLDRFGNIWVEKGSGRRTVLFSSHFDVDPKIRKLAFRQGVVGGSRVIGGVLDNAVGCYLNVLLARAGPKKGRAIYVFTASEETGKRSPRSYCRSAREVLRELRRRGIKPDLCVAIDVTHPRLLRPQERTDWSKKEEDIFDMEDATHAYLDGYSRRDARKLGIALVRRFGDTRVAARRLSGHDEAHVYSRLCPAFAFGPMVYGHFDKPGQEMPLAHARTALRFLRALQP